MNVGFVAVSWRPDAPAGIERSVAIAATGLSRLGHRPLIITAHPQAPATYKGMPIHTLTALPYQEPTSDQTLRAAIDANTVALRSELARLASTWHLDALIYLDGLWGAGRAAVKIDGLVSVLAVHVVGHRQDLAAALDLADTVIAPSSEVLRQAADAGYDTTTWQVVPNGHDSPAPPAPHKRQLLRTTAPIRVLSRLGANKGILELLEGLRRQPPQRRMDVRLGFAGFEETTGSQHHLLSRCRQLAGPNVHVDGWGLGWDEVAAWLASASVVIVPSQAETFGLVALESMAVGTPVVANSIGNLPHLIGDAGILTTTGPGGLIQSAHHLLADETTYLDLSYRSHRRAARYEATTTANELVTVLARHRTAHHPAPPSQT